MQNKQISSKNYGRFVLSILSIIILASFPTIFMWATNAQAMLNTSPVWTSLLYYICGALFQFCILFFTTKKIVQSALVTLLWLLIFSNYSIFETATAVFFQGIRYWHVLPTIFVVGVILSRCIFRYIKDSSSTSLIIIVTCTFSALLIFNFITIIQASFLKSEKSSEKAEAVVTVQVVPGQRNFYYLLFDEYASIDFMKKYYDYDNTAFAHWLENMGFSVSYSSRGENDNTYVNATNYIYMDYVETVGRFNTENLPFYPDQPSALDLAREHGYDIIPIGYDTIRYGLTSQYAVNTAGTTRDGRNFATLMLEKTPLYPFIKVNTSEHAESMLNGINYVLDRDHFKDGSKFTVLHLRLPHDPFVFDAEGNQLDPVHYSNWNDPRYYLGQYKYTTTLMYQVIEHIIDTDPNAVIALLSDHSVRGALYNYSGIGTSEDGEPKFGYYDYFSYYDKCMVFAALYLGENVMVDIEGMTGINIMRTAMNELFSLDLPLLPYRQFYNQTVTNVEDVK